MVCKHCLQDTEDHGPLGYCPRCGVWYKEEGVEDEGGVFHSCKTAKTDPEKCDDFVQSLMLRMTEIPDGEGPPIINTTTANMRQADQICAECGNKNFVLD